MSARGESPGGDSRGGTPPAIAIPRDGRSPRGTTSDEEDGTAPTNQASSGPISPADAAAALLAMPGMMKRRADAEHIEPHEPEEPAAPAGCAVRKQLHRDYNRTCWGGQLRGDLDACSPDFSCGKRHFKNKFCPACRRSGLTVPATHVRALTPLLQEELGNRPAEGFWKDATHSVFRGVVRVVNNTSGCLGPWLVVYRDRAPPDLLAGDLTWAEIPPRWVNKGGDVVLVVAKGTLVPPSSLLKQIYGMPVAPPEMRPHPRPRTVRPREAESQFEVTETGLEEEPANGLYPLPSLPIAHAEVSVASAAGAAAGAAAGTAADDMTPFEHGSQLMGRPEHESALNGAQTGYEEAVRVLGARSRATGAYAQHGAAQAAHVAHAAEELRVAQAKLAAAQAEALYWARARSLPPPADGAAATESASAVRSLVGLSSCQEAAPAMVFATAPAMAPAMAGAPPLMYYAPPAVPHALPAGYPMMILPGGYPREVFPPQLMTLPGAMPAGTPTLVGAMPMPLPAAIPPRGGCEHHWSAPQVLQAPFTQQQPPAAKKARLGGPEDLAAVPSAVSSSIPSAVSSAIPSDVTSAVPSELRTERSYFDAMGRLVTVHMPGLGDAYEARAVVAVHGPLLS